MAHRGEDLYEQHAQLVYRYLFSLCRDADLAEELCQETFCQSLRQLGSFRGDCTPQVWLCAIAKRLWYKELERRKRNVPLEEEHLAGQAAPDDPAQETEQREGPAGPVPGHAAAGPGHPGGHPSAAGRGLLLPRHRGHPGPERGMARVRFYRGKEELARIMGGDRDGT